MPRTWAPKVVFELTEFEREQFVCWEGRRKSSNDFFNELVAENKSPRAAFSALGPSPALRRLGYVESQCAHYEFTLAATLIQNPKLEWVAGGGYL